MIVLWKDLGSASVADSGGCLEGYCVWQKERNGDVGAHFRESFEVDRASREWDMEE